MRFVKAVVLFNELEKLEKRNEKLSGLEVFSDGRSPYEQHKEMIIHIKGNGIIIIF
jgi:hypothetical protein